jgi:hypothetical protein
MPRFRASPAVTSNRSVRLAATENARHGFCSKNHHLATSFGTDQVSRRIRWAQKCDGAEQLGERITRRYDRSLRRRLAPAGNARAEAELDLSSARSSATVQPAASVTWELAEALGEPV